MQINYNFLKNSFKMMFAGMATYVMLLPGMSAKAQTAPANPWRLGVGLETGVTTGNNEGNFELGGTVRLQYGANKGLAWTLTSGYYNYFGKTINIAGLGRYKESNYGIVPVKLGVKAYFANRFYFGAEAGAGFETGVGNHNTDLILSPGLGWSSHSWDVGARYEHFIGDGYHYGLAGLRIAYGFGL